MNLKNINPLITAGDGTYENPFIMDFDFVQEGKFCRVMSNRASTGLSVPQPEEAGNILVSTSDNCNWVDLSDLGMIGS